jgi:hypothetical protein
VRWRFGSVPLEEAALPCISSLGTLEILYYGEVLPYASQLSSRRLKCYTIALKSVVCPGENAAASRQLPAISEYSHFYTPEKGVYGLNDYFKINC